MHVVPAAAEDQARSDARALFPQPVHRFRVGGEMTHAVGAARFHGRVERGQHAHQHAGRVQPGPQLERPGRYLADDLAPACLRGAHRVEEVAADAGIVVRVEHGPDHHRLAARGGELLVPFEIGPPLLPVEEEGAGRHREQSRPRARAERTGHRQQLVVGTDLSRERRVARADVADDLVGRESERAELQPFGHELAHRADLERRSRRACARLPAPSPRRAPAGDPRGTHG